MLFKLCPKVRPGCVALSLCGPREAHLVFVDVAAAFSWGPSHHLGASEAAGVTLCLWGQQQAPHVRRTPLSQRTESRASEVSVLSPCWSQLPSARQDMTKMIAA